MQVKRSTKFEKIINAYCAKKGKRPEEIRFVFNGQRIRGDQTPDHLDMVRIKCHVSFKEFTCASDCIVSCVPLCLSISFVFLRSTMVFVTFQSGKVEKKNLPLHVYILYLSLSNSLSFSPPSFRVSTGRWRVHRRPSRADWRCRSRSCCRW